MLAFSVRLAQICLFYDQVRFTLTVKIPFVVLYFLFQLLKLLFVNFVLNVVENIAEICFFGQNVPDSMDLPFLMVYFLLNCLLKLFYSFYLHIKINKLLNQILQLFRFGVLLTSELPSLDLILQILQSGL